MRKKCIKKEYVIYTICFVVCFLIFMLPFLKLHRGFINNGDGFNQSFPVFVYIGQWLRSCLRGEMRFFDFRIGLGDDVIHALNWHGFGDITQVLSVFFPYQYAEYGYAFVMILKLWLCGMSFLKYSQRYVFEKKYRVLGALFYAFSTYAIMRGFNCWMFLMPMITLPLIWCGIDDICSDKKISPVFILGLWIQSLNGFYFLYIEVILTIVYFLIHELICIHNKRTSEIIIVIKNGLLILGQAVIALFLGAPLLVPSVVGFLQSNRNTDISQTQSIITLLWYPFSYYEDRMAELLIPNGGSLAFGVLILFGIFLTFCSKNHKEFTMHKALLIVFSVLGLIPLWGSITNGFSYVSDRWLFGLVLVTIMLAIIGLEKGEALKEKAIGIFYLICVILLGFFWHQSESSLGIVIVAGIYAFAGITIPLLWNNRRRFSKLIFPLGIMLIVMNGLIIWMPRNYGGVGYTWSFLSNHAASDNVNEIVDTFRNEEKEFERKEFQATSLGAALIKPIYGTTEYLSTLNANTYRFFDELYISPGIGGATWVLTGLDGRTELEALLSVGQTMDYSEHNSNYIYRKNEEILPLGVGYSLWMEREEFDELNPMEKESALLKYIVLEQEDGEALSDRKTGENTELSDYNNELIYTMDIQNVDINQRELITGQDAVLRIYVNGFSNANAQGAKKELYIQFPDFRLLGDGPVNVTVGNKTLQLRNASDSYYTGENQFWVNVTEYFENEKGVWFEIKFPENNVFSMEDIHVYEHTIDDESIIQCQKYSLHDLHLGVNEISGETDAQTKEMVLFTIPYSNGWRAFVDGEEQKIYRADVGFLAVPVEAGEHIICLEYRTPGLLPGVILCLTGIVILVLAFAFQHYKAKCNIADKKG